MVVFDSWQLKVNLCPLILQDCNDSDPTCPLLVMDSLVFEMNKKYKENKLQLLISPIILYAQPHSAGTVKTDPLSQQPQTSGVNTSHVRNTSRAASHGSSSAATHTTVNANTNTSSTTPRLPLVQQGFLMLSGLQVTFSINEGVAATASLSRLKEMR